MAAVILAGGAPGKRFSLPSGRVMIHQPWGGAEGQSKDINIQAREILRLKEMLIGYIAEDTGKTAEAVAADMERDNYMSASDALEYGIIDRIMNKTKNGKK